MNTLIKNGVKFAVCALLFFPGSPDLRAQVIQHRDPLIERMVREISSERLSYYLGRLASFHTRHNQVPQADTTQGIWAAMRWAEAEMKRYEPGAGGRLSVELQRYISPGTGRISERIPLPNLVATLRGTDPTDDRVLLVSAHMDSRVERHDDFVSPAPGANDDGSGVIAVMEMIRVFSQASFPATIKFVLVSAEEQGLLGARHIAAQARDEGWNLIAMLTNDMIGNSSSSDTELRDNMRVRVFSEGIPVAETPEMAAVRMKMAGENDSKARQLARYIKEVGERYVDQIEVAVMYRHDRFLRGGDHAAFSALGFTAVRMTEFNENYDRTHQTPRTENGRRYGDEIAGVDIEYVRKNAGVNLATLANLAAAPKEPENVGLVVQMLSNRTLLEWEAPRGGKRPAGYYVLLRESSASLWQKKIFVSDCRAELPYSRDNYFFAVQSVDEQGHESLPVFPVPVSRP